MTGSKKLREELGKGQVGNLRLFLDYDTKRKVPSSNSSLTFSELPIPSFGELWSSNLHKSLVLQVQTNGATLGVQASRGANVWVSFILGASGTYVPDADVSDRLLAIAGGWRYYDAAEQSQESYDGQGRLLSVSYASGATLNYVYSDANTSPSVAPAAGLLITVQDQVGRTVQFRYEQPAGVSVPRIKQVVDPLGQSTVVSYGVNNYVSQLNWPDGKSRQYLYERSDLPWAVTGIVDENASRLATYAYNARGLAIDTQWSGGVDHFSASYSSEPQWNTVETYISSTRVLRRDHYWQAPEGTLVASPNGSTSSLNATLIQGIPRLTSQSQPAGSGCNASTSSIAYDANGNTASKDDFNGTRACYVSDLSRNFETTRVEGLSNTTTCSTVTGANAPLPTGSRKVTTQWHPDWRLQTKVAEPGRLTTNVYNGQPDPFNNNSIASCAPAVALLPDGKPIAALCKQVEQATADTNGSSGTGAAAFPGIPARTRQWTYNANGQVLTEKDALNNTTSYAYYTDTVFTGTDPNAVGHSIGDLQSVTNAAGKVSTFNSYNKAGQLLQSTDANGVVTTNTYDPRQRLLSTTTAGETISYAYDGVGQLITTTLPNGSTITNSYDAAHRLTQVADAAGNKVVYTLDNSGNRIGEQVKDASGVLVRNITRSFDALNRVQSITGARQ